ncbi:MAG: BolA family transcriptional regulator [Rickettsiales bacterium]|nr:BolA family transcriptional regulator [Rickettsiales bacterium]
MPMHAHEIEALLDATFPDGKVELTDLAGDNDHYSVIVTSEQFRGKSRVIQHKMVFNALNGAMDSTLHALQVKTLLPE